jgi:hypothetical protein
LLRTKHARDRKETKANSRRENLSQLHLKVSIRSINFAGQSEGREAMDYVIVRSVNDQEAKVESYLTDTGICDDPR